MTDDQTWSTTPTEDAEAARPASPYLQAAAHRAYDAYLKTYPRVQDGDYTARLLLARTAAGKPLLRTQVHPLVELCRAWVGRCSSCRGLGFTEWPADSCFERTSCASCAGTGVRHV